jgi:hypothetical protein
MFFFLSLPSKELYRCQKFLRYFRRKGKKVYLLFVHLKDQEQDIIDSTDTGKEITVVYQDPLLKNDDI